MGTRKLLEKGEIRQKTALIWEKQPHTHPPPLPSNKFSEACGECVCVCESDSELSPVCVPLVWKICAQGVIKNIYIYVSIVYGVCVSVVHLPGRDTEVGDEVDAEWENIEGRVCERKWEKYR